jgi:hypothetical protein
MEAIHLRSAEEVILAVPPSSTAGQEDEIAALESPGREVHGSPA